MRLSLEMGVKQQLAISPQLQQAIRLLQLSSQEILAEIHDAVERNPLLELEESENKTIGEHVPLFPNYTSEITLIHRASDDDALDILANTKIEIDLATHLYNQIYLQDLSPEQQTIATSIIDEIDNNGYLQISVDALHKGFTEQNSDISLGDIAAVLSIVQNCDPPGVGARNIQECILLQLQRLDQTQSDVANAIVMTEKYFDAFSQRDFKKISKQTMWSINTINEATQIIKGLNPRPGTKFTQLTNHYVIPDVFVRRINGQWCVYLNPATNFTPRINKNYLSLLNKNASQKDTQYFKDNLKHAKWLITSLQNRHQTLLKVSKAIMNHQKEFLERGAKAMNPLRLATIAEQVELHESTISRITTSKYIYTPHGIYELKHFFSSQVHSNQGKACSSTAIKALIKQLINEEDKHKPRSDNLIMQILNEQGINLARRTVTKYREAMCISTSTERKRFG